MAPAKQHHVHQGPDHLELLTRDGQNLFYRLSDGQISARCRASKRMLLKWLSF